MPTLQLPDSLVSVDWLNQHLGDDNLVILDSSWHMPATGRDGFKEWQQEHIPGARFFDFDGKISDPDAELPHMMPSEEIFTHEMQALGINQDSVVVVYDVMGMFSSPRGWWMLRAMGCENCALLDGGLVAWDEADYSIESLSKEPAYKRGNFVAKMNPDYIADVQAVLAALDDDAICVLDARPLPRFSGAAEEPRPGLRRGHMPGALNLPFPDVFKHGLLKPKDELKQMIEPLIADSERVIYSCGSGVTACVIAFAALYVGYDRLAIYDGSWCEWGLPCDLPVVSD
ncbi:MAG: 3-mercaptopyruvate sulfurtransferase [Gammaproteobacteria bacterium]|nr:3-mercaptopyruvate sulfurtransferase [Gammaproteobacteria bacterium]